MIQFTRLSSLVFLLFLFGSTVAWAQSNGTFQGDGKFQGPQLVEAAAVEAAAITGAVTTCNNGMASIYPCDKVDLMAMLPVSALDGNSANDIWGWTDPQTGSEYALVGLNNGTAFVDVSDPENPVFLGRLPTHSSNSSWRDIKVYADHAFIVSEASSHGTQVFDLTQLGSVANPPVTFSETAHYNGHGNAHNLVINEATGFAYVVGSNQCSGGLHMVNIQNPTNPVSAGCFSSDGYTHDAQCVVYNGPDADHVGKEICFNSNEDTVTIVDVTNKNSPVQISRTGYPQDGYTHQGWLTEDHQFFLLDDELDELSFGLNTYTRIWDLTDLDDPVIRTTFTNPAGSIDHNQYVKGTFSYQSNYTSGLRILDISDIDNPTEAAFFDTFPSSNSKSFSGTWSNYPYFESGIVIVSGIGEGLFILRPDLGDDPPPAGDLEVTITPVGGPIVIPPGGGSMQYMVDIVNNDTVQRTFNLWVDLLLPSGSTRTRGPFNLTVNAGDTFNRTFNQNIPAGAPAGTYTATANVGTFPTAEDADSFTFEKSATKQGGAVIVDNWDSNIEAVMATLNQEVPAAYDLAQNYPNPFNPSTTIRYNLTEDAAVTLRIFNTLGQHVRTLVQAQQVAGTYTIEWDGRDEAGQPAASGTYLYRLEAPGFVRTNTMMLLK